MTISGNSLYYQSRPDFWYDTVFTIPDGAEKPQLHATIVKDSTERPRDIGKVVVALFEVDDETLKLGVINSFDGPLASPVTDGWDLATDQYLLKRVERRSRPE